jgi:mannose-6-phosphate isomerase
MHLPDPTYEPKTVTKPWGREIWYADQTAYAGKLLIVNRGKRLSLQYHERKVETLYLLSGRVILTFGARDNQLEWLPGYAVHIPANTLHRFEAAEDSVLLEVSTPDLTDVIRLDDDYSRPQRD